MWLQASDLLKAIYHTEKSMIAFSYSTSPMVIVFAAALLLMVLLEVAAIFGLNVKVVRLLDVYGFSTKTPSRLRDFQKVIARVIFYQTIHLVVFFFLPFLILFFGILNFYDSEYISLAAFAIMPLYAPLNYLLIISNVKPYREQLLWAFGRVVRFKSSKSSSQVNIITVVSYDRRKTL